MEVYSSPHGDGRGAVVSLGPEAREDAQARGYDLGGIDVADRLPEKAAAKLRKLRGEAADLVALHMLPYRQAQERRDALSAIETRITELTQRTKLLFQHPLVVAEKEKADKLRNEISDLNMLADMRRARSAPAMHLVQALEAYAESLGRRTVTMAPEHSAPKLGRGETIWSAVDGTRARIEALKAEMRATRHAPIPSREAKELARQYVAMLAERGTIDTLPLIEAGRFPILPVDFNGPATSPTPPVDTVGMMAFLFRDQFLAALEREISINADDSSALTATERNERMDRLGRELLALERQEEALIVHGAENHQPIERRPDADPRAVLGLSDNAPAPRDDI